MANERGKNAVESWDPDHALCGRHGPFTASASVSSATDGNKRTRCTELLWGLGEITAVLHGLGHHGSHSFTAPPLHWVSSAL